MTDENPRQLIVESHQTWNPSLPMEVDLTPDEDHAYLRELRDEYSLLSAEWHREDALQTPVAGFGKPFTLPLRDSPLPRSEQKLEPFPENELPGAVDCLSGYGNDVNLLLRATGHCSSSEHHVPVRKDTWPLFLKSFLPARHLEEPLLLARPRLRDIDLPFVPLRTKVQVANEVGGDFDTRWGLRSKDFRVNELRLTAFFVLGLRRCRLCRERFFGTSWIAQTVSCLILIHLKTTTSRSVKHCCWLRLAKEVK